MKLELNASLLIFFPVLCEILFLNGFQPGDLKMHRYIPSPSTPLRLTYSLSWPQVAMGC